MCSLPIQPCAQEVCTAGRDKSTHKSEERESLVCIRLHSLYRNSDQICIDEPRGFFCMVACVRACMHMSGLNAPHAEGKDRGGKK